MLVVKNMPNMILTPVLRDYLFMSDEEKAELNGIRRAQYRYRLNSRIAQTIEDFSTIIEYEPSLITVDWIMTLLQEKLRKQYIDEDLVIRIEFRNRNRN